MALIERESQHSQYFITSFKRGMLEFADKEICNYYLVESRERVSKIRQVSQEEARGVIDRIADS